MYFHFPTAAEKEPRVSSTIAHINMFQLRQAKTKTRKKRKKKKNTLTDSLFNSVSTEHTAACANETAAHFTLLKNIFWVFLNFALFELGLCLRVNGARRCEEGAWVERRAGCCIQRCS